MTTPFQQRADARRAKSLAEVEAAKKTLEDATTVGAGFWVSYIFLMFYIAVSAGAVTHSDLLREEGVKLPFLNLDLPLLGFFFLAPILFIIMHMFTLSKLVMLAEKAKRFLRALEKLPTPQAREKLRQSLPSNIFVQFMAGPTEISGGGFGGLLRLMGWITMAIAPVVLLLFLQIQFLPYHSFWHTWEHRCALLIDLVLLWWLWRRSLNTPMHVMQQVSETPAGKWERSKDMIDEVGRWIALLFGLTLTAIALFASLVLTYPTEWEISPLAFAPRLEAHRAAYTEALFAEKTSCTHSFDNSLLKALPDKAFGEYTPFPRWPCNTLQLEEFNIFEVLKLDDANKLGGRDFTIRLRERRLEGANFFRAKLGKADLRQAKLQDATLADAQLQGATLDNAQLQGADFSYALVWRADFSNADPTDARAVGLNWKPVAKTDIGDPKPWTQANYAALRNMLTTAIPEGEDRTAALKRIDRLICTETKGKSDCVEDKSHPEIKSLTDEAYAARLAELLKGLVCNRDNNAIYILRGLMSRNMIVPTDRLDATAANASKLIDDILKPKTLSDCPVSAALTAEDKARLLKIKQQAEKKFPPKPAPAKPAQAK